jgi:hypothetical protein
VRFSPGGVHSCASPVRRIHLQCLVELSAVLRRVCCSTVHPCENGHCRAVQRGYTERGRISRTRNQQFAETTQASECCDWESNAANLDHQGDIRGASVSFLLCQYL